MAPTTTDTATNASGWDLHAATYDQTIGKWFTDPVSRDLIGWVNSLLPFDEPSAIVFDNGCGTGVVTRQLAEIHADLSILATDVSPAMVAQTQRIAEEKGFKNVRTKVQDAMNLDGVPNESFSHVLSVAMVGSTPDPMKAIEEMFRVTKPGGIMGVTSWGGRCWTDMWQKAVRESLNKPDYEAPGMIDERADSVEDVRHLLEKVGWKVVDVREQEARFRWENRDEAMEFFWEHGNPIANVMQKGLEGHAGVLRPALGRVFDEFHPDASTMTETAIVAVAWKP